MTTTKCQEIRRCRQHMFRFFPTGACSFSCIPPWYSCTASLMARPSCNEHIFPASSQHRCDSRAEKWGSAGEGVSPKPLLSIASKILCNFATKPLRKIEAKPLYATKPKTFTQHRQCNWIVISNKTESNYRGHIYIFPWWSSPFCKDVHTHSKIRSCLHPCCEIIPLQTAP